MSTSTAADTRSANIGAVEEIYAAFGRSDIPAVLERLSDDVRWDQWADSFGQRAGVAHLQPRTGRDGAAEFFGLVAGWEIAHFSVLGLMAGDDQVAAEVVIEAKLPNGGRLRDEELHVWSFGPDGRVSSLRHWIDTAKHIAAARGEDTVASA